VVDTARACTICRCATCKGPIARADAVSSLWRHIGAGPWAHAAVPMVHEPEKPAERVTVTLPLEEFRFITEYDPDRERSASRADMVAVLGEIAGLLRAYRVEDEEAA